MANNILQTTELISKLNAILIENSTLLNRAAESGAKFSKSLKPSDYAKALKEQEKSQKQIQSGQEKIKAQSDKMFADREKQIKKEIALESKKKNEINKSYLERERQINKITNLEKRAQAQRELQVKKESDLRQRLLAQRAKEEAQAIREQNRLQKTRGLYNRVQIAINKVTKAYQDLAVRKQLGGKLSEREEKQLVSLQAKLLKYNNALKQVDAQVGKNQRNVGNYSSALLGLGNTFRSLASAFGFTSAIFIFAQGLMDAARTIGAFDSGLKDVSKTTGLTGNDLSDLGDEIIDLSDKLRVVGVRSLLEYATVAGQLGVKGKQNILDFAESLAILETASDITGEEGGRNIARLLTIVDGGVQNVSDFADEIVILGNNFAATENEILGNATAIAQNTGVYKLGRQEILAYATATKAVGLEAEITGSAIGRTLAILEESITTGKNIEVVTTLLGKSQKELGVQFRENSSIILNDFLKALNGIDKEGKSVNRVLDDLGITAIRDKRVFSTLATGGYDVLTTALVDVANASGSAVQEFETASSKISLAFTRVQNSWERLILSLEDGDNYLGQTFISTLEDASFAIDRFNRLLSFDFSTTTLELAIGERKQLTEGIAIINKARVAELDLIIEAEKANIRNAEAVERQNKAYVELNGSLAPHLEDLDEMSEKYEELAKLLGFYNKEQEKEIETVGSLRKDISDLNTQIENSSKLDIEGIRLKQDKIKELQKELDAILGVASATKAATREKIKALDLEANGTNSLKQELEGQIRFMEQVVDLYPKGSAEAEFYIKTINDLKIALGEVSAIDVSGAMNEIQNSIDNSDTGADLSPSDDTEDNWQQTFQSVTDIARRAFGIIDEIVSSSFERQFKQLEKQKETALLFAGESATGRAEIEAQYEEKRKVIQRREAKTKKAMAIFDITVDTAGAVVRALPNVVLASIVGALGLAQLVMVASTPIPQFWEGGRVGEGGGSQQIMVNDDPFGKKGANYKEVIQKPNGDILKPQGKNVKMTVPNGSYVHPTYDSFINSLDTELIGNNIMPVGAGSITPIVVNQGLNKGDVLDIMQQHGKDVVRAINNKEAFSFTYDERGAEIRRKKLNNQTKIMNARYSGKGMGV